MKKILLLSLTISLLLNTMSIALFAQNSVDANATTTEVATNTTSSNVIAYMEMEKIVQGMPEYKKAQSDLEAYAKQQQQHLKNKAEAIKKYEDGILQQKQAGGLSPKAEQEAQQKSQKMRASLQEDQKKAQQLIAAKERNVMQPIETKFGEAVNAVAKANNYAYIVDVKVFLYYKGGVDATALIQAELAKPKAP